MLASLKVSRPIVDCLLGYGQSIDFSFLLTYILPYAKVYTQNQCSSNNIHLIQKLPMSNTFSSRFLIFISF